MATPMGNSMGNSYDVIKCTCMHVWGTFPYTHTPSTHPPTPKGTLQISKNSISQELIEIIQFCLKILNLQRLPHLWAGVWFDGWMNGWVGQ